MKSLLRNTKKSTKNDIRKVSLVALTLLSLVAGTMRAQVFIMEEDMDGNLRVDEPSSNLIVPYQATDLDEYMYVPLGSGWLLLSCLAGAYMLRNNKKERKSKN